MSWWVIIEYREELGQCDCDDAHIFNMVSILVHLVYPKLPIPIYWFWIKCCMLGTIDGVIHIVIERHMRAIHAEDFIYIWPLATPNA